jgi:hypothetical protein
MQRGSPKTILSNKGKIRDECLNQNWFLNLNEVKTSKGRHFFSKI